MQIFGVRRTYMDYASAPPVLPVAERAMRDASRYIGNPGGIHGEAVEALAALSGARERISAMLSVKARELVFTSGLTESNNLAILGFARSLERKRRTLEGTHWIVSAIEHTSVLDCFAEVERMGGSVSHAAPDAKGRITSEAVKALLRNETVLASVGWGNNEIGIVQELAKIRAVLRAHEDAHSTEVLFHSDAGQAPVYLGTTAHTLGVDLLALGSNKLYGPHGVGALFIHNRADIVRTLQGGPQERKLRPGTENVSLAIGFAAAYEQIARERESESRRIRSIRNRMAHLMHEGIPGLAINGDLEYALPHMLNVSIPNIHSEYLTLALDRAGIAVSTKSACREGEESESHVVAALLHEGDPAAWRAKNTIRFSLGRNTRAKDAVFASRKLAELVNKTFW